MVVDIVSSIILVIYIDRSVLTVSLNDTNYLMRLLHILFRVNGILLFRSEYMEKNSVLLVAPASGG